MDNILSEMDFMNLVSGDFAASPDDVRNAIGNPRVFLLDVRTDVESGYSGYPMSTSIPLNELADRLDEILDDRMVIVFGGTPFQSAVAFFYLRQAGFDEVKAYVAGAEALATALKPGPLFSSGKGGCQAETGNQGCSCS